MEEIKITPENDKLSNNDILEEHKIIQPVYDKHWKCYLYGSYGSTYAYVYVPVKGKVPNFIQRWFSDKLLACKWVKE